MSGRGRGTPRVSPLFDSDPIISNLPIPSPQVGTIESLGNGRWCYTLTINADSPQGLTASFVVYDDQNGNTIFFFPKGATRGLLEIEFTPGGADSQLEVEIFFPDLIRDFIAGTSRGIFSLPGAATFPATDDTLGGELPIAIPVFQTQAEGTTTAYRFGLPFCVPAGCPAQIGLKVRVEGTVAGSSVELQRILMDNFGC